MLPDILEIARSHGLIIDPKTEGKQETLVKCPFCKEDAKPGKEKKFYLSLNTNNQVYKCWFCGESGGVFRFIALLKGISESEAIKKYCKRNGHKTLHPAERLTTNQLRLLGYKRKPNWAGMRKRDMQYYKRTRSLIWEEWKMLKTEQKRLAFQELVVGVRFFSYKRAIQRIKEREQETGISLLEDVLKIYSLSKRPEWTKEAETFALHVSDPQNYPWPSTEKRTKAAR